MEGGGVDVSAPYAPLDPLMHRYHSSFWFNSFTDSPFEHKYVQFAPCALIRALHFRITIKSFLCPDLIVRQESLTIAWIKASIATFYSSCNRYILFSAKTNLSPRFHVCQKGSPMENTNAERLLISDLNFRRAQYWTRELPGKSGKLKLVSSDFSLHSSILKYGPQTQSARAGE